MANILLIDDSEVVRKLVIYSLERQGHLVEVASAFRHGLRKLRKTAYDLILMDLNMPEIRGEVGIKLLRERLQLTTPIIILSAEIKVDTVIEMKPLDVSGFVAKGRDFEARLIQEVTRVLKEKEDELLK
jgi:DNA-binding response OmpR family regulator